MDWRLRQRSGRHQRFHESQDNGRSSHRIGECAVGNGEHARGKNCRAANRSCQDQVIKLERTATGDAQLSPADVHFSPLLHTGEPNILPIVYDDITDELDRADVAR